MSNGVGPWGRFYGATSITMEVGLWTMAIGARLLKVALLTMLLVGCEFLSGPRGPLRSAPDDIRIRVAEIAAAFRRDPRAATAEWGPGGRRTRYIVVGRLLDYSSAPGSLLGGPAYFEFGNAGYVWCAGAGMAVRLRSGQQQFAIRTSGATRDGDDGDGINLQDCEIVLSDALSAPSAPEARDVRISAAELASAFQREPLQAAAEWGPAGLRGRFVVVGSIIHFDMRPAAGSTYDALFTFEPTEGLSTCGPTTDMPGLNELAGWPWGTEIAIQTSGGTMQSNGELTFAGCALVVDRARR